LTQIIANETNLKTKKYILKCSMIDYTKLRFKIYKIYFYLNYYFNTLYDNDNNNNLYKNLKNNNFIEYIGYCNKFYHTIIQIHELSKLYKLDDLMCIDFNCEKLSNEEISYISSLVDEDFNFDYNLIYYKNNLQKIKSILMDNLDKIKSKILYKKFYFDPEYKLTEDEFNFTILLYYSVSCACEVSDREKLGYILKMLLSEYDWKLFRNAFNLFYDDFNDYPDYIKGKYKFVETFDEDKYDYRTKIVHNEFYPDEFDLVVKTILNCII
jgi:hypothetical protein